MAPTTRLLLALLLLHVTLLLFSPVVPGAHAQHILLQSNEYVAMKLGDVRNVTITLTNIPTMHTLVISTSSPAIKFRPTPALRASGMCNATLAVEYMGCLLVAPTGQTTVSAVLEVYVATSLEVAAEGSAARAADGSISFPALRAALLDTENRQQSTPYHALNIPFSVSTAYPKLTALSKFMNLVKEGDSVTLTISGGVNTLYGAYFLLGPFPVKIDSRTDDSITVTVPSFTITDATVKAICSADAARQFIMDLHTGQEELTMVALSSISDLSFHRLKNIWCNALMPPVSATRFHWSPAGNIQLSPRLAFNEVRQLAIGSTWDVPTLRSNAYLEAGVKRSFQLDVLDYFEGTVILNSDAAPLLVCSHPETAMIITQPTPRVPPLQRFTNYSSMRRFSFDLYPQPTAQNASGLLAFYTSLPHWFQLYTWVYSFDVVRPTMYVVFTPSQPKGRQLSTTIAIGGGGRTLLNVAIVVEFISSPGVVSLRVDPKNTDSSCVRVSETDNSVRCHPGQINIDDGPYTALQYLDVDDSFSQEVNLKLTVAASNCEGTVIPLTYTPDPVNVGGQNTNTNTSDPNGAQSTKRAVGLNSIVTMDIGDLLLDGQEISVLQLHFIHLAWGIFLALVFLRWLYRLLRLACSWRVTVDTHCEVTMWQSLRVHHLWLGVLWPCHHNCATNHLLEAAVALWTVFGIATVAINSEYSPHHVFDFIGCLIASGFGSFLAMFPRSILSALWFMYKEVVSDHVERPKRYSKERYRWLQKDFDVSVKKRSFEGVPQDALSALDAITDFEPDLLVTTVVGTGKNSSGGASTVVAGKSKRKWAKAASTTSGSSATKYEATTTNNNNGSASSPNGRRKTVAIAEDVTLIEFEKDEDSTQDTDDVEAVNYIDTTAADGTEDTSKTTETADDHQQMLDDDSWSYGDDDESFSLDEYDLDTEPSSSSSDEDDVDSPKWYSVKLNVRRYQLSGWLLGILYMVGVSYYVLGASTGWSREQSAFMLWCVVGAAAWDLILWEQCVMAAAYLCRWMTNDRVSRSRRRAAVISWERHPYMGEVRLKQS